MANHNVGQRSLATACTAARTTASTGSLWGPHATETAVPVAPGPRSRGAGSARYTRARALSAGSSKQGKASRAACA